MADKPKPLRTTYVKRLPIPRPVYEGPLTPRLRLPQPRDAIGFTAQMLAQQPDLTATEVLHRHEALIQTRDVMGVSAQVWREEVAPYAQRRVS